MPSAVATEGTRWIGHAVATFGSPASGTALLDVFDLGGIFYEALIDRIPASSPESLPPGGLSRSVAIDLAGQHRPLTARFVSATAGRFGDLNINPNIGPGDPVGLDHLVWAVTFVGDMTVCSPMGPCQSPRPGTSVVILDYRTGEFLESAGFSPAP